MRPFTTFTTLDDAIAEAKFLAEQDLDSQRRSAKVIPLPCGGYRVSQHYRGDKAVMVVKPTKRPYKKRESEK